MSIDSNIKRIFEQIDENKKLIESYGPLSNSEITQLEKFYRVELTYTSNAIEGNSLSLIDTKILLEDGLTAGGKPVKHLYEALGHAKAYDYMLEISKIKPLVITERIILRLHELFYSEIDYINAGRYRQDRVFIQGSNHIPPKPIIIRDLTIQFIDKFNEIKDIIHPVHLAAFAHKSIVDIHPFIDGNGRISRLLMNLILLNKGYQIISISNNDREKYINSLENSPRDFDFSTNFNQFIEFIANIEMQNQDKYIKLLQIEG